MKVDFAHRFAIVCGPLGLATKIIKFGDHPSEKRGALHSAPHSGFVCVRFKRPKAQRSVADSNTIRLFAQCGCEPAEYLMKPVSSVTAFASAMSESQSVTQRVTDFKKTYRPSG